MSDINLVTTCNFHGQEYLVKMNVINCCLDLVITSKLTGEEWQCNYDIAYIENLTQKTGNFKQFDIFMAMLKSGLLKTTDCIMLDLLTFDDLEALRSRRIRSHTSSRSISNNHTSNRRYLIVTYSVEFDRINYPLPLEYCGLPDPILLQAHIKRLEIELVKVKEEASLKSSKSCTRQVIVLQKRIDELTTENEQLKAELKQMKSMLDAKKYNVVHVNESPRKNVNQGLMLGTDVTYDIVAKLQYDKIQLKRELDRVRSSERCLKNQLQRTQQNPSRYGFSAQKNRPGGKTSEPIVHNNRNRSPKTCTNCNGRRSRSVSPYFSRNTTLNRSTPLRAPIKTMPKPRSRSSSATSSQYSSRETKRKTGTMKRVIHTAPIKQSKNASQINLVVSRGNSFTSDSSSSSRRKLSRSRSSTTQYRDLEGKIINLQRILNDNLNLK